MKKGRLLSDLESMAETAKLGAVPAGTPLPHQLKNTPMPLYLHPPVDYPPDNFTRWWKAQTQVFENKLRAGIVVSTIGFSRPVMVDRRYCYFVTMVFGGPLDGRRVTSGLYDAAQKIHSELVFKARKK